jgi:hypothetical protein
MKHGMRLQGIAASYRFHLAGDEEAACSLDTPCLG